MARSGTLMCQETAKTLTFRDAVFSCGPAGICPSRIFLLSLCQSSTDMTPIDGPRKGACGSNRTIRTPVRTDRRIPCQVIVYTCTQQGVFTGTVKVSGDRTPTRNNLAGEGALRSRVPPRPNRVADGVSGKDTVEYSFNGRKHQQRGTPSRPQQMQPLR